MTENESIIKHIEENNNRIENIKFFMSSNPDANIDDCKRNIEILAISNNALEKQIPKKVKIQQWIYTKCDCGYEFSMHHGDGYYSIPIEKKTNYCPECGQKLDWSDSN